jgi:two-component system response regulator YesN
VSRVIAHLEANCHRPVDIDALAHQAYLSSNYLRTVFRRATGETIQEMQTRFRMEKAVQLLKDPTRKVKDVAEALGYEYPSHFIAHFERYRGMTPTEYRRRGRT